MRLNHDADAPRRRMGEGFPPDLGGRMQAGLRFFYLVEGPPGAGA